MINNSESKIIQEDHDLKNTEVAVVIVNWNGKEYLKKCLVSLQKNEPAGVIVVDNGSDDGSCEMIKKSFLHVTLITLENNTGFAHANNVGIAYALSHKSVRHVITLNNDTEVDADYIHEMCIAANKNEKYLGGVQPKVLDYDDHTIIDATGVQTAFELSALNRGRGERDRGQYDTQEYVFGPSASAALYTREALEAVAFSEGLYFDHDYFAYYEDVDLAWRLHLARFKTLYAPKAKVFHVHSATGKSYSLFKSFHIHRNHLYNIIKNAPLMLLIFIAVFLPIRYILLLCSVFFKKGPSAKLAQNNHQRESMIKIVARAWLDVIRSISSLMAKRHSIQSKRKITSGEFYAIMKNNTVSLWKVIFG